MSIDRSMPWLVFPPAVDLANTVVATPRGPVDLLTDEAELATWIAAEAGRIPHVEAARSRLAGVRDLRDAVSAFLHARATGGAAPPTSVAAINAASVAGPAVPLVDRDFRVSERPVAEGGWAAFCGVVARSAIDLAGPAGDELAVCGAPSCGMLFLTDSPRRRWCSPGCGNRARVARHAARRRGAAPR